VVVEDLKGRERRKPTLGVDNTDIIDQWNHSQKCTYKKRGMLVTVNNQHSLINHNVS
jgi:hypothetical protein